MWGDDRDHAAGAEQQPVPPGLPDGIRCFLPDFGSITIDDGMLAHPATDDAGSASALHSAPEMSHGHAS